MRVFHFVIITCLFFALNTGAWSQELLAKNEALDGKTPSVIIQKNSASTERDTLLTTLLAYPDVYADYKKGRLDSALVKLASYQAQQENNPDYYNLIGVLSLKQRHFVEAAAAFEHVVLMQPSNAGAWLDLAIANVEAGNHLLAASYFDYIHATFAPNARLQQLIAGYRKRMELSNTPQSKWQHSASLYTGVDTNANSGLQSNIISITLGPEKIDLTLDPSFKPRRDNYLQLLADSRYRGQFGLQNIDLSFSARQRSFQTEHAFSTSEFNANIGLQRPSVLGDAGLSLHLEYFALDGSGLLQNSRLTTSLEHSYKHCRSGISAESEWRRYPSANLLNANVLWAQAGVSCAISLAGAPMQLVLLARFGQDTPDGLRPGGITKRKELIAQLIVPLPKNARAELSLSQSDAQDQQGYSALLENNAARDLKRANLRLQLSAAANKTTDLILQMEENRLRSNLALFRQTGKNISLGLQKRF